MNAQHEVLNTVIATIRSTINEDWIQHFDIDADTRFNDDLELESIEFVKIAEALQRHYGEIDIIGWLSGKDIHELIGLSVGQLAEHIITAGR
ncbi:acyl carrier protein [Solimonas aquatica]|uniref:Acyl carrier protein n=1 Tax=Solimonas aquatica TaxID=489703 RepID=A0A1H9CWH2_9GAMM|nr:acyl carrier protein [Solimonas aquatica]SEQ05491.1 acyl carrier protein [Solimonas aquatica]